MFRKLRLAVSEVVGSIARGQSITKVPKPMTQPNPTPAKSPRRQYDSSRTRVGPVFGALSADTTRDPQWVRRLLSLAAGPGNHPWDHQNLQVLERFHHPAPGAEAPSERGLRPPVSLLSWLIRNIPVPESAISGEADVAENRRALARRDPGKIADALNALRKAGGGKGWHVLEGPTSPDVYLVTPDALIVVEGKRTEPGPTRGTEWMPGRHQMFRHIDAAWEIRGNRAVYGLFVVEGVEGGVAVPPVWAAAATETRSETAVTSSLPHRSAEEQQGIRDAFVGVTTWRALVNEFGLPSGTLS